LSRHVLYIRRTNDGIPRNINVAGKCIIGNGISAAIDGIKLTGLPGIDRLRRHAYIARINAYTFGCRKQKRGRPGVQSHALGAVHCDNETAARKTANGARYTVTILALYGHVIDMGVVDKTCVLIHIADLRRIRRITADLNVIATVSAHSLWKGKLKILRNSTGGAVKLHHIAVCIGKDERLAHQTGNLAADFIERRKNRIKKKELW